MTDHHPVTMPWSRAGRAPAPWRRAVVYGLGLSGRAAAAFLVEAGVAVVAVDGRDRDQLDLSELADAETSGDLRCVLGDMLDDEPQDIADLATEAQALSWDDVDGVVVSPGVPVDRPLLQAARDAGVPVLGELELAFPFLDGPVLAITGSNGKSTTTSLTGEILRAAGIDTVVAGNIGEPAVRHALVAHPRESTPERVFVLEVSSFQLETIDLFRPAAATLLNLSADHLDRHHDLASYRRAKLRLFENHDARSTAVLNADDPAVVDAVPELRSTFRFFSRQRKVGVGAYLDGSTVVEAHADGTTTPLFERSDVPLAGPHNLENAMAAALLARTVPGVDADAVVRGLRAFRGLPHRVEAVRTRAGVTYYDDSKGTNPAATVKSLEGFDDGSVHLILGGRFKGGDLREMVAMARRKVARVYLIGESAERFAVSLSEGDTDAVPHEVARTLDVAVERAADAASDGDVVLLSPACSSFDQFTNFAERGRRFQDLVRDLPAADDDESDGGGDDGA